MSGFWIMVVKFCLLFLVAHVAIAVLSRHREGDTSERTNHRRGWWLVGIMTVAAVGLAIAF